jgi:hypothetical protein
MILAVPVSAQIGLTSAPRSVSLLATRQSSVTVAVPSAGVVTTEWNIDPAQPLAMTLRAFVSQPVRVPAHTPIGGAKSMVGLTGHLTATAPGARELFAQPMAGSSARGGRRDQLSSRDSPPGILTLVVTTQ